MHWVRPEASTPSWYWQEHHLYMNCNRNKAASGRCWTSRSHCHSPPVHFLALSRTSRSCVPIRSTPVACNSLTEYWNNSIVSPKRFRITHTHTHLCTYVCMSENDTLVLNISHYYHLFFFKFTHRVLHVCKFYCWKINVIFSIQKFSSLFTNTSRINWQQKYNRKIIQKIYFLLMFNVGV